MRRPAEPEGPDERITAVGPDDPLVQALRTEIAQLQQALVSRQQIGVATGLLAQRFGCSPDRAWSILVRISQHLNVRVRDLAAVLVRAQAGETTAGDAELLDRLRPHLPGTAWVRSDPPPQADGEGAVDGHRAPADGRVAPRVFRSPADG